MAAPEPDHLVLPRSTAPRLIAGRAGAAHKAPPILDLPPATLAELWLKSDSEACELTRDELYRVLLSVGNKFNFGQSADVYPNQEQQVSFLWHLRLSDLALATACALGREAAWKRFFLLYRASLTQAAIAISHSETVGHDLADSLYAELYGLRVVRHEVSRTQEYGDQERRSPLASYSGRGSLHGWLRTTLAQRYVDRHRRTYRETPLDIIDVPAPEPVHAPLPTHLLHLKHAVMRTLRSLVPENRFLLAVYFLDERTLREIAAMLHVHEATISRRIKRLSADLRDELLHHLQSGGLSAQAAEEAIGIDPRDLEINLRWLLQSSQSSPFPLHEGAAQASLEEETQMEEREQS